MMDPIVRLGMEREMRLSIEIEAQITGAKSEPLLIVLRKAKETAALALAALACADPEDAKEIRRLQNEVARFDDLVSFLRATLVRGKEAEAELSEQASANAPDYVLNDDDHISPTEGASYAD